MFLQGSTIGMLSGIPGRQYSQTTPNTLLKWYQFTPCIGDQIVYQSSYLIIDTHFKEYIELIGQGVIKTGSDSCTCRSQHEQLYDWLSLLYDWAFTHILTSEDIHW